MRCRSGATRAGRYCTVAAGFSRGGRGGRGDEGRCTCRRCRGARCAALRRLDRHQEGTAAAETVVLTTTMPSIVSAHHWMLGPAPSRCRRSPSTSVVMQDDTPPSWCADRRVLAGICKPELVSTSSTTLATCEAYRMTQACCHRRCTALLVNAGPAAGRAEAMHRLYHRWTCGAAALGHPGTAIAVFRQRSSVPVLLRLPGVLHTDARWIAMPKINIFAILRPSKIAWWF